MIWPWLGLVLLLFLWHYLHRSLNHFNRMGIKQTRPWPLLGDYWRIFFPIMSLSDFVVYMFNIHPGTRYIGFYQFTKPALLIRDPELIKQVTVKDFDAFTDRLSYIDLKAEPLWSGNLFALSGKKWKKTRTTLSGSFTSSKIKNMFDTINEAAIKFALHFEKEPNEVHHVEFKDVSTRFANDVIATTAFGIEVDSLRNPDNTFYRMGQNLLTLEMFASLKIITYAIAPYIFQLFKTAVFNTESATYFRNIIRETIETREQNGIVRQDMIHLLLQAKPRNSKSVADGLQHTAHQLTNDIASKALIFFLAGLDTVSNAMCFGSYELALNQEVQDKLREEIRTTHQSNRLLTYKALMKMKYLDMVITEVLRKWTPTLAVDRVCTRPYTIKPVMPDELPVYLKKGDIICLPYHAIHRCPTFYPNPEKFDPERFSHENKHNIRPYTYLPFGIGPRNCIGSRFALMEIKILFYHLLLNFEIVPIQRTPIPLTLEKGTYRHTSNKGFWLGLKKARYAELVTNYL